MPKSTDQIRSQLGFYIPSLLRKAEGDPDILTALQTGMQALEDGSLSWARLNQMMHLCTEPGMSEGFFRYYFLQVPERHPYPVDRVFSPEPYAPPEGATEIKARRQLEWGLRRFIYDAMLYWGNFRQCYRELRPLGHEELAQVFSTRRTDTSRLIRRGEITPPETIPRDHRYLISEMACQTYEEKSKLEEVEHVAISLEAFRGLQEDGKKVTRTLLEQEARSLAEKRAQIALFDLLGETPSGELTSEEEVLALYAGQWQAFKAARASALRNTRLYLSMCSDLDVYVATSMRTREDFREMAKTCDEIFQDERLKKYNIRYFDPTLSAAKYHEDKGIIECLMVKTSKVLLYFAQHKESLGKVSEYAMALSQGKPVIIFCPKDERGSEIYSFYRDRHPLIRLIEFQSGIVNGGIVTQKEEDVIRLLERILSNQMEYDLEIKPDRDAYYLLKERLTKSTVRVISDDRLLNETFWNNYHNVW